MKSLLLSFLQIMSHLKIASSRRRKLLSFLRNHPFVEFRPQRDSVSCLEPQDSHSLLCPPHQRTLKALNPARKWPKSIPKCVSVPSSSNQLTIPVNLCFIHPLCGPKGSGSLSAVASSLVLIYDSSCAILGRDSFAVLYMVGKPSGEKLHKSPKCDLSGMVDKKRNANCVNID